jgi:hypothetical protein
VLASRATLFLVLGALLIVLAVRQIGRRIT